MDFLCLGPRNNNLKGQSRQRFVGTRQTFRGVTERKGGHIRRGPWLLTAFFNFMNFYLIM